MCHLGLAHISLQQIEIMPVHKDAIERWRQGSDGYAEIQMYTPRLTTGDRQATKFTHERIRNAEDFLAKSFRRDLALQRELLNIGRMITDLRKDRASKSVEPNREEIISIIQGPDVVKSSQVSSAISGFGTPRGTAARSPPKVPRNVSDPCPQEKCFCVTRPRFITW
jgi:hypothetical protein